MEEAERLCSRIAIIDHGKIITAGTLENLIQLLPYKQTIHINKNQTTETKKELFSKFGTIIDDQDIYELTPFDHIKFSEFFKATEDNGIAYNYIDIQKPSLEALFLHLTGRRLKRLKNILHLIKKDYILFWNDKPAVGLTFIVPIFLIYLFGSIFSGSGASPSGIRIAFLNNSNSKIAKKLESVLDTTKAFQLIRRLYR